LKRDVGEVLPTSERIVATEDLVEYLVGLFAEAIRLTPVVLLQGNARLKALFAELIVDGISLICNKLQLFKHST
jgi:hypothetical protein